MPDNIPPLLLAAAPTLSSFLEPLPILTRCLVILPIGLIKVFKAFFGAPFNLENLLVKLVNFEPSLLIAELDCFVLFTDPFNSVFSLLIAFFKLPLLSSALA